MDLPIDLGALGPRGQSALGLVAFTAIAWVFSSNKARFPAFAVLWTIAAQIAIAALLLYLPPAREALGSLQIVVRALQQATTAGTSFVFGYLGGGAAPFEVTNDGAMFNFAFQALPLMIFFSGLSALLYRRLSRKPQQIHLLDGTGDGTVQAGWHEQPLQPWNGGWRI